MLIEVMHKGGSDVEDNNKSLIEHRSIEAIVFHHLRQFLQACSTLRAKIPISRATGTFIMIILFYIICSAYYCAVEGWNVLTSVYFITVTITTIGYGDVLPSSDNSRVFTIFVILFGVFYMTPSISAEMTLFIKALFHNVIGFIYRPTEKKDEMGNTIVPSHWKFKIGVFDTSF